MEAYLFDAQLIALDRQDLLILFCVHKLLNDSLPDMYNH